MEDPTPFDRTGAPEGPTASERLRSDGFERAVRAALHATGCAWQKDAVLPDHWGDQGARIVRAVLQAIREPDEGMQEAGNRWRRSGRPGDPAATIWQAMIDHLLSAKDGD